MNAVSNKTLTKRRRIIGFHFPAEKESVLVKREMDRRIISVIRINAIKMGVEATSRCPMLGFIAVGPKPKGRPA